MPLNSTLFLKSLLLASLTGALSAATGCTYGTEDDPAEDGADIDDGPDTSICPDYCGDVMSCAGGWGGGGQQYHSESMCEAECVDFIEGGGGCGSAASDYFTCAALINDCDDYALQFVAEVRRKRYFQWTQGNLPEESRYQLTVGRVFGDMFRGIGKIHMANIFLCDEGVYMLDATPGENRIWQASQDQDNLIFVDM